MGFQERYNELCDKVESAKTRKAQLEGRLGEVEKGLKECNATLKKFKVGEKDLDKKIATEEKTLLKEIKSLEKGIDDLMKQADEELVESEEVEEEEEDDLLDEEEDE